MRFTISCHYCLCRKSEFSKLQYDDGLMGLHVAVRINLLELDVSLPYLIETMVAGRFMSNEALVSGDN